MKDMKGLLLLLMLFEFCCLGFGQQNEAFNYQTIVHNKAGDIVASNPVSFIFTILKGSTSGKIVYSEKQTTVTNPSGLVSLSIGNGTDNTGDLTAVDWETDNYFLKVETDPAGGSSYSQITVTQLLNTPAEQVKKTSKKSTSKLKEDEFLITRKYAGQFLDYRHTGPGNYAGPNLIWIKTSMDKTYGKIAAFGKTCQFKVGENLYLRKIFFSPGDVTGYWIYQIENDSSFFYRLSEFQYDKKLYVETWF
jgi:hypothetical protein